MSNSIIKVFMHSMLVACVQDAGHTEESWKIWDIFSGRKGVAGASYPPIIRSHICLNTF